MGEVRDMRFVFGWLFFSALVLRADEPKDELITIQKGNLPIILSAPHGGRKAIPNCPERKGTNVEQFVTVIDTNTSELAEKFAAKIERQFGAKPYLVIAHFERKYLDVNRPPEGAYEADAAKLYYDRYHTFLKESIKEVQQEWGRGILLDIHGQAATKDAIYRGTRDLKSVTLLKDRFGKVAVTGEKSLLGQLVKRNFIIIPGNDGDEKETKFNGGHITNSYGSHTASGIDAMQLEFGGDCRAKAKLDKTADDLTAALEVFAKEYLPKEKVRK
jgi:N-formylglutamate amidohydrolase